MKKILILVTVMTANAFAVERNDLMPLIAEASTNKETTYVEIRNKIVEHGTEAVPILGDIAVDENLSWQQQLVARICHERITQKEVIEKLLATDWYSHPKIDPDWPDLIIGKEGHIADKIVKAEIRDAGVWHYCLELEWKMTGEKGNVRERRQHCYWTSACSFAVKDNPEERVWFLRVCDDLMATTPSPPRSPLLYSYLRREKKTDTVPLLLQHFDMYVKSNPAGFEPNGWLLEVEKYADARSADLFDTFIQTHPNPFNLTSDKIRARPAPPPVPEPPFRLGTNIVRRAKQP